jgi:hypothetical protein
MSLRITVLLISSLALSASGIAGADLASYRNFRLGMTIADVTRQANFLAPSPQLISSRPERIEELDWHVGWAPPGASQSSTFSQVVFHFYNSELFEIAATYDRDQTHGLTEADMVEAISAFYGPVAKPALREISFNSGVPGAF